jgi:hypothetical protein
MQYNAIRDDTIPYDTIVPYNRIQYNAICLDSIGGDGRKERKLESGK